MKRASLSLSINAIVVLILAIAMLGLALGFIKTMFGKVSSQVEAIAAQEPEPRTASLSEKLTLSRETVVLRPTETTVLKFSAYSTTAYTGSIIDGETAATTTSTCFLGKDPLEPKPQVPKDIAVGGTVNSQILVKAKSSTGDKICQICAMPSAGGGCVDVRVIIKQ